MTDVLNMTKHQALQSKPTQMWQIKRTLKVELKIRAIFV